MKKTLKKIILLILAHAPFFKNIIRTRRTQTPITLSMWFLQKVVGFNRKAYWPVHFSSIVTGIENIYSGIETCPGYMPGCYIQGIGKIYIGDYTQISSNVAIISANHDLYDNRKHADHGTIRIGKYCWLGTAVTILPNVELGEYTIVGAGAVVTKSFKEGYCVIAGNPARVVKTLEADKCVEHRSEFEYNGYIPHERFSSYQREKLNV